jgi:hypothetical protein|tara:strand:- start:1774 stop:2250 length:477 start_codon:yes stop_codon:yes gene_type:complete
MIENNHENKTLSILYKNVPTTNSSNQLMPDKIANLDIFLENEKILNKKDSWNKLDKTMKIQKCTEFITTFKESNELNENETLYLTQFLKDCIERKKLSRTKDVVYNTETGKLISIPLLLFVNKRFTLKNSDKKTNSSKALGPKKNITLKSSPIVLTPY